MTLTYPTDYPFHVDDKGWPESVYAPPYPFEHYYDNGRNSRESNTASKINNNHYQRPNSNSVLPLPIRRHTPGSTDLNLRQLSPRTYSRTSNAPSTVKRHLSQPNRSLNSVRFHSPTPLNPDERPIKPMKDTSVYNKSSIQKKTIQRKISSPRTPKPPLLRTSKSIKSSPRYEFDSFQSPPPPPSRTQMNTVLPRRPVRTDLIPKTPFRIPPQRNLSRPIVVEEYEDYPVTYIEHIPKKIISYQPVTGMTTRELENYQMSRRRRVVRVRSPPVETIIYEI